jgi:hypothetical protein
MPFIKNTNQAKVRKEIALKHNVSVTYVIDVIREKERIEKDNAKQ